MKAQDRILQAVYRDWLPTLLNAALHEILNDDPWLKKVGRKRFWLEIMLFPFLPLAMLFAIVALLRTGHMAEYMAAE